MIDSRQVLSPHVAQLDAAIPLTAATRDVALLPIAADDLRSVDRTVAPTWINRIRDPAFRLRAIGVVTFRSAIRVVTGGVGHRPLHRWLPETIFPSLLEERKMAIRLGDKAPDFEANTTVGKIRFHEWLGNSWGLLFSHPKDYTPVCTTELGRVAALKGEFEKLGVKVIGLSVDALESHQGWARDIAETQGTALNFPVIADADKKVATLFDMIHPNASDTMPVRSVFVIGPDKSVKLMITYPASTGRNFDEILRVIDSLQLTAKYKLATPADWRPGQDVIISTSVSDDEAAKLFPGYKTVKSYLRTTPQPKS